MRWELLHMDCRAAMAFMADDSVDSVVCDPPYHLTSIVKRFGSGQAPAQFGTDGAFSRASRGFMGQTWDGGEIAFDPSLWAEVLRVLKPGGHLVAFGGTRTFHRMACAIEDSGFEIRDQLAWVYGSGFPKSHNVGKAIDKAAGVKREAAGPGRYASKKPNGSGGGVSVGLGDYSGQETRPATPDAAKWDGWGTALKPALEPICLARKPLSGTVVETVLQHGTGALHIEACRVGPDAEYLKNAVTQGVNTAKTSYAPAVESRTFAPSDGGRWPANLVHDGSDEVLDAFPDSGGQRGDLSGQSAGRVSPTGIYSPLNEARHFIKRDDSGSAARFFYCAKASKRDREEGCEDLPVEDDAKRANVHPTVKPTDLMRWLVRLVTPPGGTVFDPFTGSGSTGKAAMLEGFRFVGCEMTDDYIPIARARIAKAEKDQLTGQS